MNLLSWIPRVRSLYSRYFSTMGASSLWALAVFWKRAESETISGEDRALLSSSYFSSVWSRRSNMGYQLYCTFLVCHPERRRRRICDAGVEGPLLQIELGTVLFAAGAARQSPVRRRAVSPTPWPRSRRRW